MNKILYTPRIQPDETLYSYIARCHFLWGGANHRQTSVNFFGRLGVCLNQCLPTEVSNISKHADYPADYLVNKHTFLPLFDAMSAGSSILKQAMLGSDGKVLANASGVSQLRKAELTHSKFCPVCFDADVEKIGVGYWHLMHQFFGVKSCYCHGCKLIEININPRLYTLPELPIVYEVSSSPVIQNDFAKYVAEMTNKASSNMAEACLHNPMDALINKPTFRCGTQIHMKSLLFLINSIEAGLDLPPIMTESCIRNILKNSHHNAHPLKQMLLQFSLDFIPTSEADVDVKSTANTQVDQRSQRCLNFLKEYCFSMRDISRRTGCSLGFIKALAKRNGIALDERRQFITADIERKVIDEAIKGLHRKDISTKYGISVGAVEQIIESVAGLAVWRQYLRMYDKRNSMRKVLLEVSASLPEASRKDIKTLASSSYMWLFKYDKTWLNENLPPVRPRAYFGGNMWIKRDEKLLPQLSIFLVEHRQSTSGIPSLNIIDKNFGGHTWFTRSLNKLPKCKAVYDKLTKPSKHN